MKTISVVLIILLITPFASARHARVSHGKHKGLEGTVTKLGTNSFTMTLKDGNIMNVTADNNTKFFVDDQLDKASSLKEGDRISVEGTTPGENQVSATEIRIHAGHRTKKKAN